MRKHKTIINLLPILMMFAVVASGQRTGRLSQKLLLENTIQQRVTNAMSKVLDESQFVVDVKVDLAYGAGPNFSRNSTGGFNQPSASRSVSGDIARGQNGQGNNGTTIFDNVTRTPSTTTNPFPIPGFPSIGTTLANEPVRVVDDPINSSSEDDESGFGNSDDSDTDNFIFTEQSFDEFEDGDLPQIRSMSLNIILEDGVSPQTIENVRQVALVASRFDRDRGDVLSITTASFKDRPAGSGFARGTGGTGQDLADRTQQIVSEQTAELRETLKEAEARNDQLMQEIRDREMEFLEQSEEERKKALSDLASVQNERAKDLIFLQQQREESNSKLQEALLNQIDKLRQETTNAVLSEREQIIKTAQATSLEDSLAAMRDAFNNEKAQLQAQIEAALNPAPTQPQGLGGLLGGQGGVILGIMVFLIMLVAIVAMAMRSRAPTPAMGYAPPYPQRPRRKRPKKSNGQGSSSKTTTAEEPTAAPVVAAPPPPQAEWKPEAPTPTDNADVLQAELKSIRQSVVSMSVGRQGTATRILGDWLNEDAGAEPSSETPTADDDGPSDDAQTEGEDG